MAVHSVETYLKDLAETHRTGGSVAREPYHGLLENVLRVVGPKLQPARRRPVVFDAPGSGVAPAVNPEYHVHQ